MKRLLILALAISTLPLGFVPSAFCKDKPKKNVGELDVTVLRDSNGEPVRNAAVIIHSVSGGKQKNDSFEVKTDSEGRAAISDIHFGKYRLQIIAPHLQTYGEDFEISGPTTERTIKLKAPQGQYSIY